MTQWLPKHIYLTATREGAPLAAELAVGEGPPRVYRVEPLGTIEDDPNVTDKRSRGTRPVPTTLRSLFASSERSPKGTRPLRR